MTFGQRKPKIKGSRVVVEVREDLEPFTAIELNDDIDIILQKSADLGYSLVIDDNLVDVLKFRVTEGTLAISSFYKVSSKRKMEIIVYYDELKSITLREGKIDMEDVITTENFAINTFGDAKLRLNVNAVNVQVLMLENSFADLTINADSLNISLKDRVDAKIYATGNSHSLEMYKNAQAKMEGKNNTFTISLFESASLKAEALDSEDVNLSVNASSSATINPSTSFTLNSKESGKTYLHGNAKITIVNFLDTSQLIKKQ